jgi:hypothetical protein
MVSVIGKRAILASAAAAYLRNAVSLPQVKVTTQHQEKLEALMKVLDFKVRYKKGSFKSGYCIIEEQNVAVINKFFPMESKVAPWWKSCAPDREGTVKPQAHLHHLSFPASSSMGFSLYMSF